jgi:hypothetical protein
VSCEPTAGSICAVPLAWRATREDHRRWETLSKRTTSQWHVHRLSRLGFVTGHTIGGLAVGVVWLGTSGALDTSSTRHLASGYKDIASIHLQPVPEGPTSPMFVPTPKSAYEKPLALVRGLVPDPLPRPLDQPRSCDHGGDLIIVLNDGREITYGPCDYPWEISQLWGAMIQVSEMTVPGVPNIAAAAAQEQVRQALRIALTQDQAKTKSHYTPTQITCAPAKAGRDEQPPGYFCAATLRSETGPSRVKHLTLCASLVAGRFAYARAPSDGICPRNP